MHQGNKMASFNKAILFFNPKSGQSKSGQRESDISDFFQEHQIQFTTVHLPKPEKEISEEISRAISQGVDLFIAAGGDGTVSMVSNALIGTQYPLVIIPLGTGNLLAKELNIPQKLEDVLNLIVSEEHSLVRIDTFSVNGQNFVLNVGVGVTPEIMGRTASQDKQRYGIIAYLIHFVQQILGLKLHRFSLEFDGQEATVLASEVLITNGRSIGVENLKWSQEISLTDGILDLYIFRATNIYDILSLLISIFRKNERLNPILKIFRFKNFCRIGTQKPIRVQADGDPIGYTPIEIKVNPGSLSIISGNNE